MYKDEFIFQSLCKLGGFYNNYVLHIFSLIYLIYIHKLWHLILFQEHLFCAAAIFAIYFYWSRFFSTTNRNHSLLRIKSVIVWLCTEIHCTVVIGLFVSYSKISALSPMTCFILYLFYNKIRINKFVQGNLFKPLNDG